MGGPLDRSEATGLIIYIDMLICISFVIGLQCMLSRTKQELKLVRKNTTKLTDFAIELNNLPDLKLADDEQLKEKIALFIAHLVKNETTDIF